MEGMYGIGVKRGELGPKGIPDGFVIFPRSHKWAIIEVELRKHDLTRHIISQVADFYLAWSKVQTKRKIVDAFHEEYSQSPFISYRFAVQGIKEEVYHFLSNLIEEEPTLVVITDELHPDLESVKASVRFDTTWTTYKTYARAGTEGLDAPIFMFEPVSIGDVAPGIEAEGQIDIPSGPMRMSFLGRTVSLQHSKEIPVIVANAPIDDGCLKSNLIPWGPGKKRYLVSAEPTHPSGRDFFAPVRLKNGRWVETHASKETNISLASRLSSIVGEAIARFN